ncbi:P-loop ATPase, Sll1717 family [Paracoccus suum]|uniref:P-loop ATPase, Sll1717 family n=1 Tax=Paracoccus suum TaxID=2259340 RepID=UPI0013B0665C|nr:hypothetical protein [Paracoccus suum]
MRELAQIENFGGTDADDDPLLLVAFEDHRSYIAVHDLRRYVVLGRKGSGKTAIFRKLLNTDTGNVLVEGHVFSDYPWHHHAMQRSTGVPDELCYVSSWEYLINVSFAKILLNRDESYPYAEEAWDSAALLERFIVDTYGVRDPLISNVFTPSHGISVSGKLGIDLKLASLEVAAERVPFDHLPTIVQEVNRNLLNAILTSANPDIKYIVCFDELDLGFTPGDADYAHRLMGLLVAAKRFNSDARKMKRSLLVVVFLRTDIFNILRFEDRNKILEGGATTISWDTTPASDKLSSLMEKRFASVLAAGRNVAWDDVFEDQDMTSRQRKYSHMLDRTFLRPRDMIKFCNEVLVAYKVRGGSGKFSNADIISARRPYSLYLYRELEDELPKHYPDYAIYFDIVKEVGVTQFSKNAFSLAYDQHKGRLSEEVPADAVLARLFEFSIIGYLKSGGGAVGSLYVWKHKDSDAVFDDRALWYRVHYGLVEYLELRRRQRRRERLGVEECTDVEAAVDELEADEVPDN